MKLFRSVILASATAFALGLATHMAYAMGRSEPTEAERAEAARQSEAGGQSNVGTRGNASNTSDYHTYRGASSSTGTAGPYGGFDRRTGVDTSTRPTTGY